jgi:hypothetical protein
MQDLLSEAKEEFRYVGWEDLHFLPIEIYDPLLNMEEAGGTV